MQKDWARRLRAVLTFLSPPLKSSIKALLDFSFAFSTRNFFHASLPLSQNEGGGRGTLVCSWRGMTAYTGNTKWVIFGEGTCEREALGHKNVVRTLLCLHLGQDVSVGNLSG